MPSNKEKSLAAVDRLRAWLRTNPRVPQHHGKINKSEICRIIGVPVSTIGTNTELRKLIGDLKPVPPSGRKHSHQPKNLAQVIAPLLQKIDEQQMLITEQRVIIGRMQLLLSTGVMRP